MPLFEQINNDIKDAMKNREKIRLDTLRMLKSKILAVDARGNLSDTEILKLFKTYYGNLQEALEQAKAVNRNDLSENLQAELKIVEEFLPKAPSLEETKKLVQIAISETNAQSKKDVGLVMKNIMKLHPSLDGKLVKDLANDLLP